jgi:hypothetical protein
MEKKGTLTLKELKRLHVIQDTSAGRMTDKAAGTVLRLSVQQVRRLIKKQREGVDEALPQAHHRKNPLKAGRCIPVGIR